MFKSLRWILVIYGLLCAMFWSYQHLFFFQPKALDINHVFTFPVRTKFTEAKIPFDSSTVIDVVKFLPDDTTTNGVVLFFHGNRYNVEHYSTYAPYFIKHGYECWMPDYPGYGRSTGEINIEGLKQLSVQLYKMARAKYQPNQIVVYGKSMGTGVAAYLASIRDCRHLILETPYYDLASLSKNYFFFLPIKWLIRYNLETNEYFKQVTAPITVMHGTDDELIPLPNAVRLLSSMKPTDAFYVVPGGHHNTLPEYKLYHSVVDSVMSR